MRWEGEGIDEKGLVDAVDSQKGSALRPGDTVVRIDPTYFRPTEVDFLQGDASKAREVLGWAPRISFEELVGTIV